MNWLRSGRLSGLRRSVQTGEEVGVAVGLVTTGHDLVKSRLLSGWARYPKAGPWPAGTHASADTTNEVEHPPRGLFLVEDRRLAIGPN